MWAFSFLIAILVGCAGKLAWKACKKITCSQALRYRRIIPNNEHRREGLDVCTSSHIALQINTPVPAAVGKPGTSPPSPAGVDFLFPRTEQQSEKLVNYS